jgi:galactosamine-6-phosphate isomerase
MGKVFFIPSKDYNILSEEAAQILTDCVKNKPDALICIATGSSPTGAYKIFAKKIKEENIDVRKLRIIKLDEWLGVAPNDSSTCESYIMENIIKPLKIDKQRYIGFVSDAKDPLEECKRIDDFLDKNGPIDLCVLGLGKNGHLGLNEPAEYLSTYSHTTELDEKTKTHSMLDKTEQSVTQGITLGLAQLLASKQILFLVTGAGKAEAFDQFKEGKVCTNLPASMLWLHPNTTCIYSGREELK